MVGPPLFIATFLVEGATRPGYNPWRNFVSSLATGDGGWVQIVNFLVWSALALGFAIGLVRVGIVGPGIVLIVYAAGTGVAGIFVTDPSLGYPPGAPQVHTTAGMIHGLGGLVVFVSNAVAAVATAVHFRSDPRAQGWVRASLITGVIVLALFVASTAVSVLDERGIWSNAPTGLIQRSSIVVGLTWIAAFALRLRREPHN
ncbi:MAG TPA: DUF998 domain-containing protein [Candidatus Limnocylindria bacterium]